jgi:hypothetical protein
MLSFVVTRLCRAAFASALVRASQPKISRLVGPTSTFNSSNCAPIRRHYPVAIIENGASSSTKDYI